MATTWTTTVFKDLRQAEDELRRLKDELWACRGQDLEWCVLTPSIDRKSLRGIPRRKKLELERLSIDLFRRVAASFAPGEDSSRWDDIITLMVLRHYGVPTRLLDWTSHPLIAGHFACSGADDKNGELWAFDYQAYEVLGKQQWKEHPETTTDGSGAPDKFDAKLTAFSADEAFDWFCCAFYPRGFPRQDRQKGYYSLTRLFDVDHAVAIAGLLKDPKLFRRYVVDAAIKVRLRTVLREKYGIWRGPLFPDSAGAAETVKVEVFGTLS